MIRIAPHRWTARSVAAVVATLASTSGVAFAQTGDGSCTTSEGGVIGSFFDAVSSMSSPGEEPAAPAAPAAPAPCNRPGDDRWADGRPVKVTFDPGQAGDPVSPLIFGKFYEANGRDTYPGIIDQHLANGSFEDWFTTDLGDRNELAYRDVKTFANVAHGWEPVSIRQPGAGDAGKPSWSRENGGRNGDPEAPKFQRITNSSDDYNGGIAQRVPLPDERTSSYDVRFHARGTQPGPMKVKLVDPATGKVLAEDTVALGKNWKTHELRLDLSDKSSSRYKGDAPPYNKKGMDPYGEYKLVFEYEGEGSADLDGTSLMGADAVNGKFNPRTVANMKEAGVTSMRWPGGNFTSAYDWKDGIGDPDKRPNRTNATWGGRESNQLGVDEYLEFCEVTGMEPMINLGYNPNGECGTAVTPADAADLVGYLNGKCISKEKTPWACKRVENGHPEPYGVKHFQVGNEQFGPYQCGDPQVVPLPGDDKHRYMVRKGKAYGQGYSLLGRRRPGFNDYYDAMKRRDPSIVVIASGIDPGEKEWGGNGWNEGLFAASGDRARYVDLHPYTNGIKDEKQRENYAKRFTPEEYNQTVVSYPAQLEGHLEEVKHTGERHGVEDVKINVGEWNLQAAVSPGWRRPDYPTQAYAVYQAGMYNTFIRQDVEYAYQRDNTLFDRAYPLDTRPIHPGIHVTRMYTEPFEDGTPFNFVATKVNGPAFCIPKTGPNIEAQPNVPYVDTAAMTTPDGDRTYVFATNRNLEQPYTVQLAPAGGLKPGDAVTVRIQYADDPLAKQFSWDGPEHLTFQERTLQVRPDGTVKVTLPPAATARFEVDRASTVASNDPP